MSTRKPDILLALGKLIVIVAQGFIALGGLALAIALPLIVFWEDRITAELQVELADPGATFPLLALAGILVLGIVILAMAFLFLNALRQIIGTVDEGDPFAPANADRLTMMGWLALVAQLLAIPAAGLALYLAKQFEEQNMTVDAGLDLGGIVLIVTLFILARVFRQGTAMREDLEGTV